MEDVKLYTMYNGMQRQGTSDVLNEFGPRLSWSEEERVLDVGCGPGDVTAEILLPHLPRSSSIVGVDINPNMVDFANKNYSNNRVMFKVLNFSIKNITDVFQEKSFSKIFSFFCLHWIKDLEQVATNIFMLLPAGGQFLIVTASSNNVFKTYTTLSLTQRWKQYMEDLDDFIPEIFYSADPCKATEELLSSQGLEVITCEEREQDIIFPSMICLIRTFEAVNPFVRRMDRHTREQYMTDYRQIIEDNQYYTETTTGEVFLQNRVIIIHGRKP